MKFLKMFFAGLLAFVVGSAVMLFLSVVILFGIVGSMTSSEPVTVGEHAILKLDFSVWIKLLKSAELRSTCFEIRNRWFGIV